jgi:hypothetical protein
MQSNTAGADSSDDRSWWQALVKAGFLVTTYSQVPGPLMPLDKGPVAEFKRFMETLISGKDPEGYPRAAQ